VYSTAQTTVAEDQPPAATVGDRDRPPARPELLIGQRPTHSAPLRSARNLRRGSAAAAGLATLTLVLAACGGGSSTYGTGGYGAAPATPSAAAGTAATVDLHDSKLGQIIVDAQGRTLYLFEADKGGKSSCDGPCAAAWPPYLSNGAPQADMGASGNLTGTNVRADGTTQVTYGGHPLYYYAGDKASGDTAGQDIDQFGAKWYVVGKDGKKIDTD
jgi:predicted lipoprotein with Yx(FWY)xxD motif